jgi:hypothetical protein
MDGVDCRSLLYRRGLALVLVRRGRHHDRGDGVQEIAEGEAANLASLIAETPALVVQAGPPEHFHAPGAALVGRRGGDDALRIEILRL